MNLESISRSFLTRKAEGLLERITLGLIDYGIEQSQPITETNKGKDGISYLRLTDETRQAISEVMPDLISRGPSTEIMASVIEQRISQIKEDHGFSLQAKSGEAQGWQEEALVLLSLRSRVRIHQAQSGWAELSRAHSSAEELAADKDHFFAGLTPELRSFFSQAFLGLASTGPSAEDIEGVRKALGVFQESRYQYELERADGIQKKRVRKLTLEEASRYLGVSLPADQLRRQPAVKRDCLKPNPKGRRAILQLRDKKTPLGWQDVSSWLQEKWRQMTTFFESRRHARFLKAAIPAIAVLGMFLYPDHTATSHKDNPKVAPLGFDKAFSSTILERYPEIGKRNVQVYASSEGQEEGVTRFLAREVGIKADFPDTIEVSGELYQRQDYYYAPSEEPLYYSEETSSWVTLSYYPEFTTLPLPTRRVGKGKSEDGLPEELIFADGSVTDREQVKRFVVPSTFFTEFIVDGEGILRHSPVSLAISEWLGGFPQEFFTDEDGVVFYVDPHDPEYMEPVAYFEYLTSGECRVLLFQGDYLIEHVDGVETGQVFYPEDGRLARSVLSREGEPDRVFESLDWVAANHESMPSWMRGLKDYYVDQETLDDLIRMFREFGPYLNYPLEHGGSITIRGSNDEGAPQDRADSTGASVNREGDTIYINRNGRTFSFSVFIGVKGSQGEYPDLVPVKLDVWGRISS